jgi:hypothetical protein
MPAASTHSSKNFTTMSRIPSNVPSPARSKVPGMARFKAVKEVRALMRREWRQQIQKKSTRFAGIENAPLRMKLRLLRSSLTALAPFRPRMSLRSCCSMGLNCELPGIQVHSSNHLQNCCRGKRRGSGRHYHPSFRHGSLGLLQNRNHAD